MKIITTVKLRALVGNRKVNQFMRHFDLFQEKEGVGVEENMVVTFKEGEIVDEQRVYDLVRNFKAEADKATDTSFDILHVEFAGGTGREWMRVAAKYPQHVVNGLPHESFRESFQLDLVVDVIPGHVVEYDKQDKYYTQCNSGYIVDHYRCPEIEHAHPLRRVMNIQPGNNQG